ncbi:hypothetical protein M8J75_008095 [Diaphorina citri]|nr:hypothetical protein M8J75_008095 [Diaphorina citri]
MEKTPRVLLLEYLQNENGTKPVYTELPPYFPDPLSTISLFHYEVSAFNGKYVGTGYGVAKREAKHDAAKKILIKLAADKPDLKKFLEANRFDTMIERTYGGPDKNVLEKLNCLCLMNNLSMQFMLMNESGEPHNKLYTIRCVVDNLKVEATKRSVKNARNACASKMIELIERQKNIKAEIPKDFKFSYNNKAEVENDMKVVQSVLESKIINPTKASGVKLSKLHLIETDPECNVIHIMDRVLQQRNLNRDMFKRFLIDMASLIEVKSIVDIFCADKDITISMTSEKLPPANEFRAPTSIVFVRFYCNRVNKSFCASDSSLSEATRKAYVNLLKYFAELKPNTSGRSAMMDNTSSEEED